MRALCPRLPQVRRKADPVKDQVKEFVRDWSDNPRVTGERTHEEIKGDSHCIGGASAARAVLFRNFIRVLVDLYAVSSRWSFALKQQSCCGRCYARLAFGDLKMIVGMYCCLQVQSWNWGTFTAPTVSECGCRRKCGPAYCRTSLQPTQRCHRMIRRSRSLTFLTSGDAYISFWMTCNIHALVQTEWG